MKIKTTRNILLVLLALLGIDALFDGGVSIIFIEKIYYIHVIILLIQSNCFIFAVGIFL